MRDASDLAALSLPFTAGVAAAALAGGFASSAGAALAALAAAGLLAVPVSRRSGPLPFVLLFFTLGIFCYVSSALRPAAGGAGPVTRLALRAVAGLRGAIRSLPLPHEGSGPLVAALLTGDRSGLTAEQTAAFRDSGASHILALSGLHLGIIYLIINRSLSVFGHSPAVSRVRSAAVILLSGFYVLATGAGPSLVRAFIFIVLNEICKLSPERRHSPVRCLLAALTIQLAFKPEVITSLGFQLSYLAMTGIVTVYPRLQAWFPDSPAKGSLQASALERISEGWDRTAGRLMRRIWQAAALAVSCQIFTAPLVWIRFHSFPKYFILTNLIAMPLTSSLMTVSVAAIALQALGGCPPPLASLVDTLSQALLSVLSLISRL